METSAASPGQAPGEFFMEGLISGASPRLVSPLPGGQFTPPPRSAMFRPGDRTALAGQQTPGVDAWLGLETPPKDSALLPEAPLPWTGRAPNCTEPCALARPWRAPESWGRGTGRAFLGLSRGATQLARGAKSLGRGCLCARKIPPASHQGTSAPISSGVLRRIVSPAPPHPRAHSRSGGGTRRKEKDSINISLPHRKAIRRKNSQSRAIQLPHAETVCLIRAL